MIRIVSFPRFSQHPSARHQGVKGPSAGTGQAGQILASLQVQEESIESLSFSDPPLTVLAAGSVDGSIVLFDAAHNFAVRRKMEDAHDDEAVIKVEFVRAGHGGANGWLLTSCGNDGVVRRWDCRGGTGTSEKGLVQEWRGHRGGGEGGGVLGFVQSHGRIVTAGDDAVALVFQTS
jgi:ribosome assembly protein SQT1